MDFIGSEIGCRANGVVVGVFNVGKVGIPVVLVFVAISICAMVWFDAYNAALAARVVGAFCEFVDT